jgi:DNA mismatch endonuclease (patch repair protein)
MKGIYLPPSPPATSENTKSSMRGNKSSKTKPELILLYELRRRGVTDILFNCQNLPGSPDLAFPSAKLAVFVHGCFWHRCPYCDPHFPESNQYYWSSKFARNKNRDLRDRAQLRSLGWKPIVIWECKLKKNPGLSARRIIKALEKYCE